MKILFHFEFCCRKTFCCIIIVFLFLLGTSSDYFIVTCVPELAIFSSAPLLVSGCYYAGITVYNNWTINYNYFPYFPNNRVKIICLNILYCNINYYNTHNCPTTIIIQLFISLVCCFFCYFITVIIIVIAIFIFIFFNLIFSFQTRTSVIYITK